jgi:hypothetical protein
MEFIDFLIYLYNAFDEFIQQIHPQLQEDFYN